MKAEILKILELQEEGKLTKEQAAELLAIIADQAREKTAETASPNSPNPDSPQVPSTGQGGAPGPRGGGQTGAGGKERGFAAQSAAAIHGLVDTAIGVGATIGRAASVFGGEVANMVHRDEGGNSVTLSKVDAPAGENYSFRGNTINVSKISDIVLHDAHVDGNTINASKVSHLDVTRGRFSQCNVSGSSVSNVSITGPEAAALAPSALPAPEPSGGGGESAEGGTLPPVVATAGLRGVTFNASKFSRVHVEGASVLEVSTIQAAVVRDWSLKASALRESKINDAQVTGLALEQAVMTGLVIERSHIQGWKAGGATFEKVTLSGVKAADVKIVGGTWKDVKFAREAAALSGRECLIQETAFENCDLTACDFAGCTFRRTTLRNLKLTGISVRNVDFTGMTLENEADFRRAAGI